MAQPNQPTYDRAHNQYVWPVGYPPALPVMRAAETDAPGGDRPAHPIAPGDDRPGGDRPAHPIAPGEERPRPDHELPERDRPARPEPKG